MMDHYGSMPAPSVEQRRSDAAHAVPQYGRLVAFQCLVAQAVTEIAPGSYAGYCVFARTLIAERAADLCAAYVQTLGAKWALVVRCKRLARGLRQRVAESYAPGGTMYNAVAKRTQVGRSLKNTPSVHTPNKIRRNQEDAV